MDIRLRLTTHSHATRVAFLVIASLLPVALATTVAEAQRLTTLRVVSGLREPLFVTAPAGDDRLFLLEQHTGEIRIFRNGALLAKPFLDVGSVGQGSEQGLLGMAFHPDYANNGRFFVNYSDASGDTVIADYRVSADPNVADPGSARVLLTLDQPFSNHNGGMLAFGPDGFLYLGNGDGGGTFDPGNRAQDGGSLFGKILRLDVDSASPYGIPPDNPFIGNPTVRDEIWALGLRNPWRFAIDRLTGDIYIGDVGQSEREEIDFESGASPGGRNYGWRCMEGTLCTGFSGCVCNATGLTRPILEYDHSSGRCSVTGGHVYRGPSIPLLGGTYFFGDFCSGEIASFRFDGVVRELRNRTTELTPTGGGTLDLISSFGEDGLGELYVVDLDGEVYRITTFMRLGVGLLRAGQNGTVRVVGATPGATVRLYYSTRGTGSTFEPDLGVTLALRDPKLSTTAQADSRGEASFSAAVPANAAGRTVWLQSAENANTSDVIQTTVN